LWNYGLQKESPNFESTEKNEEIISSNSLPHHKRASSFTNKHKAAWLHLLPKLSRYRRMSEGVQHDDQCSSLRAEGLNTLHRFKKTTLMSISNYFKFKFKFKFKFGSTQTKPQTSCCFFQCYMYHHLHQATSVHIYEELNKIKILIQ